MRATLKAHQSKKGKNWHFGYKAHIGVDAGSGLVHSTGLWFFDPRYGAMGPSAALPAGRGAFPFAAEHGERAGGDRLHVALGEVEVKQRRPCP